MALVKILYNGDYQNPILLALSAIKALGDIKLEEMSKLFTEYNSGNDILVAVPTTKLDEIAEELLRMEFDYEIVRT